MDQINVLIADDHTLFRKGVRKMLEADEDMKVVGEAATGREALDGIEATRILCREMPHVGIIFVTMFQDDEFVFRGLQAGGRGYILNVVNAQSDRVSLIFAENQQLVSCRKPRFRTPWTL